MSRSRGFTLIELMVCIAIAGLLMLSSAPLTKSWIDSAKQREAAGLLKQGISRAKATALRNPAGARGNWPAAALCQSGQTLKLYSVANNADINCSASTNILWQAELPGVASLQTAGADLTCIAFNSRGLPVTASGNCTNQSIDVTAGSESALNVLLI